MIEGWRSHLARLVRRIRGRIALEPISWRSAGAPRITAVVTTRNRSELLPIALRSVQLQDYTAWECIVVDDASPDDSIAVGQQFVAADVRFRLVRADRQMGLAATRNVGLAASEAEYVCSSMTMTSSCGNPCPPLGRARRSTARCRWIVLRLDQHGSGGPARGVLS